MSSIHSTVSLFNTPRQTQYLNKPIVFGSRSTERTQRTYKDALSRGFVRGNLSVEKKIAITYLATLFNPIKHFDEIKKASLEILQGLVYYSLDTLEKKTLQEFALKDLYLFSLYHQDVYVDFQIPAIKEGFKSGLALLDWMDKEGEVQDNSNRTSQMLGKLYDMLEAIDQQTIALKNPLNLKKIKEIFITFEQFGRKSDFDNLNEVIKNILVEFNHHLRTYDRLANLMTVKEDLLLEEILNLLPLIEDHHPKLVDDERFRYSEIKFDYDFCQHLGYYKESYKSLDFVSFDYGIQAYIDLIKAIMFAEIEKVSNRIDATSFENLISEYIKLSERPRRFSKGMGLL